MHPFSGLSHRAIAISNESCSCFLKPKPKSSHRFLMISHCRGTIDHSEHQCAAFIHHENASALSYYCGTPRMARVCVFCYLKFMGTLLS